MKFINDFMEKKTQDALREANEHIERKARLSELEARNKQKRNMLLHPLKSADERKEIKNLKKEIAEYEKKKEDRVSLIVLGGLFVGFMLLLSLSALFHKPSDDNPKVDEAIVAETTVDSKTESAVKDVTEAETIVAIASDEQPSVAQSTAIPIAIDTSESSESSEAVDQEKAILAEEQDTSTESEEELYVLKISDLRIDEMTDYVHYGDSIYLGNDEGLILTITINKSDALPDDLFFYYDESLLNVDISEPIYTDNKTRIKAYVTAYKKCEANLEIFTIYDLETLREKAEGIGYNIRKLDSEEGRVVYVAPTGSKYHFDPDCAGENAIATTYYDVEMMEIDPCGKCAK